MADLQEGGAVESAPVKSTPASVAPGTPININVSTAREPKSAKNKEAKQAKAEPIAKADVSQERDKGARDVLKALGVKKGERKQMLESISAGKSDQAKDALIRELQASRKEVAATKEELAAVKPVEEKAKALETRIKKIANAEFALLSAEAQKYVAKRAGDDPAAILDFIDDLRSSGMVAAPSATASTGAAPAKPSTTMAAPTQPAAKPAGTLNHYETWQQLKDAGQTFAAANYYNSFGRKIDEQKPQ